MAAKSTRKSKPVPKNKPSITNILMIEFEIILLLAAAILGGLLGYREGNTILAQWREVISNSVDTKYLDETFQLGVQDFESGRYDTARQRFEYIISLAPASYPQARDYLDQSLSILNATTTFTPEPPTPTGTPTQTLTPTYDPSGEESILRRAQTLMDAKDWGGAIDALLTLRNLNLTYRVTDIDGLLFAALRKRGEYKILVQGDLEGGIYDLSLSEKFGPLDYSGKIYRDSARLYLTALGFWQAYPAQAVYYFSQIAAAAPGLKDGGGWTSRERYRASLIQYGDVFAAEAKWCEALTQYQLAFDLRHDDGLIDLIAQAENICLPPTYTLEPTQTVTGTISVTNSITFTPSATSLNLTPKPSATSTPTSMPTATGTGTATKLPTATQTPVLPPTATSTPLPTATATVVPPTDIPTPYP